ERRALRPAEPMVRNELERDIAFGALALAAGSLRRPHSTLLSRANRQFDCMAAELKSAARFLIGQVEPHAQAECQKASIPEMPSADARSAISHRHTEYIGALRGERKLALVYHCSCRVSSGTTLHRSF